MGATRLLGARSVLAAALLLAAVMLVLAAGSADAAFPGKNGKIAFSRDNFRSGSSGIFAIHPDGSGQERLGPEYGHSSSWSANGQKVVFAAYSGESERDFNEDIYVMNADGANRVNLTKTGRVDEFGVDWSPDGGKIAFTSYRFSGMEGPAARAAEAQEGGTFTPEALTTESMAREATGSKGHSGEPQEDIEVSVVNADGTGRRDLTRGPAFDVLPAFSPSGNKIVFSRMTFGPRSEESELVVMRSDGTNKRQITDTPRSFEYGADWRPLPQETAMLD